MAMKPTDFANHLIHVAFSFACLAARWLGSGIQSLSLFLSAADRPRVLAPPVRNALQGLAIAQVHHQNVALIGRRTRQVAFLKNAGKWMAGRQIGRAKAGIEETSQLIHVRQAPVAGSRGVTQAAVVVVSTAVTAAVVQTVSPGQGIGPKHCSVAVGVFQPDQPGQVVGHRAVSVVGETG